MERKNKSVVWSFGIFTAVLLVYSGVSLVWGGPLEPFIESRNTWSMVAELFFFFLWNLLFLVYNRNNGVRFAGLAVSVVLFTWCHQVLTPLVVSGIYVLYLMGMGRLLRKFMDHSGPSDIYTIEKGIVDFMAGSALWITIVCITSALGIGDIPRLRWIVVITGVLAIFWNLLSATDVKRAWRMRHKVFWTRSFALMFVLILTMLALQAGRMNIALDYDSLHYGLRTPYILNNGAGIYENLGNINLVYTYSKGLETLVMPLSGTSTYGYVLAFNLWVTIGVLVLTYSMVRRLAGRSYGMVAAVLLAFIPGIMNMSVTAKSDNITLLFQLMFVYFTMCYILQEDRGARTRYFVLGGCACLMTYLFKPTSLVFSTVVYGVGLIYLLYSRQLFLKIKSRWWLLVVFVGGALGGLWARTVILTGVPVTSVFTSIFELFGFKVKAPFTFASIPSNQGEGLAGGIRHLADRVFHVLVSPVGRDMDHVVIAWGGPVILLLLLVIVILAVKKKPYKSWQEKQTGTYLKLSLIALGICSIISIYKLWQVDGNYFMFLYVMIVIIAVTAVARSEFQISGKQLAVLGIPVLLFCFMITCMSNWAGVKGFSPIRFVHAGYYDHTEEARLQKAEDGNEAIWNLLASDPRTRVLAIGDHPQVLAFPCNIQSYYDLTGSGGNVVLVKTLDNFKGFLRYAGTEYIYIQSEYMERGTRVWDIVNYMIEDGSLADIRYEYGNVLARVNLDGFYAATPEASLRRFRMTYTPKEPDMEHGQLGGQRR